MVSYVPINSIHSLSVLLTFLDRYSGESAIELSGLFVGEGRLLDVNLGAVDLSIWVGSHGDSCYCG